MRYLHAAEIAALFGQGGKQGRRLAHTGWHDNGVAIVDLPEGVRCLHALLLVEGVERHHCSLQGWQLLSGIDKFYRA